MQFNIILLTNLNFFVLVCIKFINFNFLLIFFISFSYFQKFHHIFLVVKRTFRKKEKMSFQSLLESTECGSANPIVDLARQSISNTNSSGNVLSLDELNNVNGQNSNQSLKNDFVSAVESLNNDKSESFQMDALLEEILDLESTLTQNNTSTGEPLSIRNALKSDNDPLFCCFDPSNENDIEELSGLQHSELPELNWADEYLKNLELNNNNPEQVKPNENDKYFGAMYNQSENVWDLNENDTSYRNERVENVSSFFSNSYLPFMDRKNSNEPLETVSDANLKDLVSDQESRLINMLLGNGQSNENQSSMMDSGKLDDKKLDDINFGGDSTQDLKSEGNNGISSSTERQQFDDAQFWMKLAEEWHSTDTNTNMDIHLGKDGKVIHIQEPLENLLEVTHPYYYQFVDKNPFKQEDQLFQDTTQDEQNQICLNYIERGLNHMKLGDLSAAVLLFEAAAQINPNNIEAWRLLGVANARNENDHKSISAMKRCLALKPQEEEIILEVLMYLASSFTNESMNTEACYALQEWLRNHPKYKNLVREGREKKDENNLQNFDSYLGPVPLLQRWSDKSNIFFDGFFESVQQGFTEAMKISNNDPDIHCGLGVLCNLSGEYEKAINCFRSALEYRPDDYCLWNRYGASLANSGRAEESISAYREALNRYPGYIRARYNLAVSCIMLGLGQQAAEHLLAILNHQTAGADSIRDLVSLNRDNITSVSVWSLLRSALTLENRSDLLEAIDEHDLDLLNKELINVSQQESIKVESNQKRKNDETI